MTLNRYFSLAAFYLNDIGKSLEACDFKTVSVAAHTLASSSGQIGLPRIAQLAQAMEAIANSAAPNMEKLKNLAEKIARGHEGAKKLLEPYF